MTETILNDISSLDRLLERLSPETDLRKENNESFSDAGGSW